MNKETAIKTLLIPIDFSETSMLALDHATHLAKIEDSKVILIHVLKAGSYVNILPSLSNNDVNADLRDQILAKMNAVGSDFKSRTGVNYEIVLADGNVAS